MYYLITYQKRDGSIFVRLLNNPYNKKIGEITSMGWKVLDIHHYYDGNFMHEHDIKVFRDVIYKKRKPFRKIIVKRLISFLNKFA